MGQMLEGCPLATWGCYHVGAVYYFTSLLKVKG